jgi:hypothetical protein
MFGFLAPTPSDESSTVLWSLMLVSGLSLSLFLVWQLTKCAGQLAKEMFVAGMMTAVMVLGVVVVNWLYARKPDAFRPLYALLDRFVAPHVF